MRARVEKVDVLGWNKSLSSSITRRGSSVPRTSLGSWHIAWTYGRGGNTFSVIIHDRDNLLSATNISAIGDIGAHPEDLCPNAPPGGSEAGSPPYLPVQGRYYPPHRHGFEYIYTGRRCSFLQTPQPHIVCLRRISSICLLNRSNQFGHHLRHC